MGPVKPGDSSTLNSSGLDQLGYNRVDEMGVDQVGRTTEICVKN